MVLNNQYVMCYLNYFVGCVVGWALCLPVPEIYTRSDLKRGGFMRLLVYVGGYGLTRPYGSSYSGCFCLTFSGMFRGVGASSSSQASRSRSSSSYCVTGFGGS